MPTPVPFDFDAAVPLAATDLSTAIAGFMGLGIVGAILVFKIGVRVGPKLIGAIGKVISRG